MGIKNSPERSIKNNNVAINILRTTGSLALLLSLSQFVFKAKHSAAIRRRDENICKYPGCSHKHPGNVSGHAHHVVPRGYMKIFGPNAMVDTPFNLLTICPPHHLGDDAKNKFNRIAPQDLKENYRPLHPDNYFAKLYYRGQLQQAKKERIKQDPGCYAFFVAYANQRDKTLKAKNKSVSIKNRIDILPRKDAYKGPLRAWRNSLLNERKIYWDDQNDSELQADAIKRTIEATKNGWVYPLIGISGNVAAKNRAEYIWSNMVVILIEEYIRKLPERKIESILAKMLSKEEPSRIIFYKEIYAPAIKKYDLKIGVVGMINLYLETLSEEEMSCIGCKFNKLQKKDRNRALFLLRNKFFNPAFRHHQKQQHSK